MDRVISIPIKKALSCPLISLPFLLQHWRSPESGSKKEENLKLGKYCRRQPCSLLSIKTGDKWRQALTLNQDQSFNYYIGVDLSY